MVGRTISRVALSVSTVLVASLAVAVPLGGTAGAHDGHPHPRLDQPDVARVSEVPRGFEDTVAIGGLSEPTALAFAPDGTAFIGLKTGVIKSYDYADGAFEDPEPTDFADLNQQVNNYWDRGLVGIEVDPEFPARPYLYVSYALNRDPRDNPPVVPKWGDPNEAYDECPQGAGDDGADGCVVMSRVSRLTAIRNWNDTGWVMRPGGEKPLVTGSCLQFPSHAAGDVEFGPDGYLYVSTGDGASFDWQDYGQTGNPCRDPINEGGSLRSQDLRTTADPTGLNGAVIRIDPDTGRASNGSTSNRSRIAAYGLRNPWRFSFRPNTSELWLGDVGGDNSEEINRIDPTRGPKENLGWPCYEGNQVSQGWDALDLPICEDLYDEGAAATTQPYFRYPTRGGSLTTGEDCEVGSSSISGIQFLEKRKSRSDWPAKYRGAMAFSDFARGCIWVMGKKNNGDPDTTSIDVFAERAENPVALTSGPGGDLYYVDFGMVDGLPTPGEGAVRRISYDADAPVAVLTSSKPYGGTPLRVTFDASASTDPNGDPLSYAWDLDGDGQHDDGTGPTIARTYTAAVNVDVSVQVSDGTDSRMKALTVYPGNEPPSVDRMWPPAGRTWSVGEEIGAYAETSDDGPLAEADHLFSLTVEHCPSVCHSHPITSFRGRSGSFIAPDHEYPSRLLFTASVTDARGMTATRSVSLAPSSVDLTFRTAPKKLALTVAGHRRRGVHEQTFVRGSRFSVVAAEEQRYRGKLWRFTGWADDAERIREIVAPDEPRSYVADYSLVKAPLRVKTSPWGLRVKVKDVLRRHGWKRDYPVGARVKVEAPFWQRRNGVSFRFVKWSDGGNRKHWVRIQEGKNVVRAVYRRVGG